VLYCSELQDLMAAYPGREFKKAELVRYCAGCNLGPRDYEAARKAVARVLAVLIETGSVTKMCTSKTSCLYLWK
jgi:hypothetical protein